jgi:hypothetical protein
LFRFFRTLRQNLLAQNRASRYLLYALGEIVLAAARALKNELGRFELPANAPAK